MEVGQASGLSSDPQMCIVMHQALHLARVLSGHTLTTGWKHCPARRWAHPEGVLLKLIAVGRASSQAIALFGKLRLIRSLAPPGGYRTLLRSADGPRPQQPRHTVKTSNTPNLHSALHPLRAGTARGPIRCVGSAWMRSLPRDGAGSGVVESSACALLLRESCGIRPRSLSRCQSKTSWQTDERWSPCDCRWRTSTNSAIPLLRR